MKPKMIDMDQAAQQPTSPFVKHWHLSTEGYFFIYRLDRYNSSSLRATLYRDDLTKVDDRLVEDKNYGVNWGHHDVINYFEARLSLNEIK